MFSILENISPVFIVIFLGYISRKMGFLPDLFIVSANRLVYFVAIPLLVFGEISRGTFSESFNLLQIGGTFLAVCAMGAIAHTMAVILKTAAGSRATFIQASFHGNLGYIGLAVVFYALGPEGRGTASVLAGFLILIQNVLSIGLYTFTGGKDRRLDLKTVGKFLGNPIILATLLGLASSAASLRMPRFLESSFSIVGDMALPLALLIIGGSLKRASMRNAQLVGFSTLVKLLALPFTGYLLFRTVGVTMPQAETAVILLASPSATVTYVMASEMGGDADLAAAAVTISTVFSIATYTMWIAVMGG